MAKEHLSADFYKEMIAFGKEAYGIDFKKAGFLTEKSYKGVCRERKKQLTLSVSKTTEVLSYSEKQNKNK